MIFYLMIWWIVEFHCQIVDFVSDLLMGILLWWGLIRRIIRMEMKCSDSWWRWWERVGKWCIEGIKCFRRSFVQAPCWCCVGWNSLCCGCEVDYDGLSRRWWLGIQGIEISVIGGDWIQRELEKVVDTWVWGVCGAGLKGAYLSLSEEWNGESYV